MVVDPELQAMSHVFETLKGLNNVQRLRILKWVKDRLETEESPITGGYTAPVFYQTGEPKAQEEREVERGVEKTAPAAVIKPAGPKTLMDYETALELFSESNVKKATTRVLLMAAYLQERHNFKEIGSFDINFRLKRIGYSVTNISSLINGIMNRVPHLLVQIGAEEGAKQSRRKFKVTNEGLAVAKSFMKG